MVALFSIFMIFCPLFVWIGSTNIRLEQELIYQLFGTILVAGTFLLNKTKPIQKNNVSVWLGIFLMYTVLLFLFGGARIGAQVMFNTFITILLYFCVLQLDVKYTKLLLKTIIIVGVANAAWILLQYIGYDPIYVIKGPNGTILPGVIDPIGFFGNKAIMGMYAGLAIIAGLIISPISLLMLPLIYISKSTADILGVLIGIMFFVWWTRRKLFPWILIISAVSGIGYVVFVDSPMGMMGTRPPMWKTVIHDTFYGLNLHDPLIQSPFIKNAFTGYGLDAFRSGNIRYFMDYDKRVIRGFVNSKNQLTDNTGKFFTSKDWKLYAPDGKVVDEWDNPHNGFVELLYNYGLIGVSIIGFLFYSIWSRFVNSIKTDENIILMAMIITFMVFTISQFPFSVARIAHLVPIILGLFVINTQESTNG